MLTAESVTKEFGGPPAIEDVCLSLETGESVALIGHNGAGKSTLLGVCAGLLEPSHGSVSVGDDPAGSVSARRSLAYVPDRPVLYDDISVAEHVQYVAGLHGVRDPGPVAHPMIQAFELDRYVDLLPQHLSRGTRQKVSILLAMIRPFQFLLADEPLSALDARARNVVSNLLGKAVNEGRGILVATHDLPYASSFERCVVLREGRVIFDGSPRAANIAELAQLAESSP